LSEVSKGRIVHFQKIIPLYIHARSEVTLIGKSKCRVYISYASFLTICQCVLNSSNFVKVLVVEGHMKHDFVIN